MCRWRRRLPRLDLVAAHHRLPSMHHWPLDEAVGAILVLRPIPATVPLTVVVQVQVQTKARVRAGKGDDSREGGQQMQVGLCRRTIHHFFADLYIRITNHTCT